MKRASDRCLCASVRGRERWSREKVQRDAVNGNERRENPKHMALRLQEEDFFFSIRHREVVTGMWHDSYRME